MTDDDGAQSAITVPVQVTAVLHAAYSGLTTRWSSPSGSTNYWSAEVTVAIHGLPFWLERLYCQPLIHNATPLPLSLRPVQPTQLGQPVQLANRQSYSSHFRAAHGPLLIRPC